MMHKFWCRELILISNPQGVGLMMANALTENGAARVYIIGRREEILEEVAAKHPEYFILVLRKHLTHALNLLNFGY